MANTHLGKLCKRGHDYQNTGMSLRRADNHCIECDAVLHKENRGKTNFHSRQRASWKYQGINVTPVEYNELFAQQNGCCAICGRHQSNLTKRLAVDHNHITGEIRGLLCHKCNQGIGLLQDDYDLLIKAAKYLKGKTS